MTLYPDTLRRLLPPRGYIFCLLIRVVLFTMPARRRTTVMRNILFWLLMLVVFLALAGC